MKNTTQTILFDKLNLFIRKYYINQLIKGGIYSFTILSLYFILITVLEYFSQFNILIRSVLFWSFILFNVIILIKLIFIPLLHLLRIGKILTYKEAAIIIGAHFQEIDDKLLNTLQLQDLSALDNELINASIEQKIAEVNPIPFSKAINYSENKKYLKWGIAPIIILFLFLISGKKHIIIDSSSRIIQHGVFFEPKAPFNFIIEEADLRVISQENFKLNVRISGEQIPNKISIMISNQKYSLQKTDVTNFTYLFKNLISNTTFRLFADGFYSKEYTISVLPKPSITNFKSVISPPKYTRLEKYDLTNVGDLNIPEGSKIEWFFNVRNTDRLFLSFSEGKNYAKLLGRTKKMYAKKVFYQSQNYRIHTENYFSISDSLSYKVNVIQDQHPNIVIEEQVDSLQNLIFFNGRIEDDYLLTQLDFCYVVNKKDTSYKNKITLPIKLKEQEQFFHQFNFSNLNLELGDRFSYFFEVWDNDAINGHKSTKSEKRIFFMPDSIKLNARLKNNDLRIKSELKANIKLSQEIQEELRELNRDLLSEKRLNWEDKKRVSKLLKKQENLQKRLSELKDKKVSNLKNKELYKSLSPELIEKQKKLNKLFDELLDEKTQKMLQEMQKTIDKMDKEALKKLLDEMAELNMEQDLDRNLELFKQLEFEQKLLSILEKLEDLSKKQVQLKKDTDTKYSDHDSLARIQNNLNATFDEIKRAINELENKNENLINKNKMPDLDEEKRAIKDNMLNSESSLQKNKKGKSSNSQKQAIEKMRKMTNKLVALQNSCSGNQENMETLRQILENLIYLSLEQEALMGNVKITPHNSPNYIHLVKAQKKLVDDALIIEDSLFALSKRVVEIEHVVNKEIRKIKKNMKLATTNLEDRVVNKGLVEQQHAMTSVNNLALLLSEMLKQMQQQCASSQSCNKPSNCNKPGSGTPSISKLKEMQEKLNQQMKGQVGKGEKGKGKKLNDGQCENLSKLARQQEEIRKYLESIRNDIQNKNPKDNIDKMIKKMEENELDIVNNKISLETIKRQEDILDRLLKAEKADREKDEEEKRESNEWTSEFNNVNNSFISYKKLKEKQLELLKLNQLTFTPFYKKKLSDYFNELLKEEK